VDYKDELKKHLIPFETFNIADTWSCEDISIGKWHDQIQKELDESDLIVYMLSANFFSSRYILEEEVKKGMELIERNPNKKILCVIVSDFVGLDKLKSSIRPGEQSILQEAVLQLADWQYLPYGTVTNKVTGNTEEKIIPLKYHPRIDEALTQITTKILELFSN
jgi:internalin A